MFTRAYTVVWGKRGQSSPEYPYQPTLYLKITTCGDTFNSLSTYTLAAFQRHLDWSCRWPEVVSDFRRLSGNMRSIGIIIFVHVLVLGHALPTAEEALAIPVAKRCHTETYGDNGATTYTGGDCTGSTFSGTNVVNPDNTMNSATATPKRDCNTSIDGDCSRDSYSSTIDESIASNATASGNKMADRDLERAVHPPECQTIFEGWANPCNVHIDFLIHP